MISNLVVISGRSGSGKSAALGALEDGGYLCIDNLPVGVLMPTLRLLDERSGDQKVAIGIDARGRVEDLLALPTVLDQMSGQGLSSRIVWMDANDATLINRFHATRRRHPLLKDSGSLKTALAQESELLQPILDRADTHLDTSRLSLHDLRTSILKLAEPNFTPGKVEVHLMSFGFKFGVPDTTDYMFDARFLPNPYWDVSLRSLNGTDQPVQDFLKSHSMTLEYSASLEHLIRQWSPSIVASGRPNVTFSIGCTGGQHRSVYCAEALARHLSEKYSARVVMSHREEADHPKKK